MEDHVGILAETIYAGNDQQRILGVAVHIPQLHGAEVVHGYHAGGNTAEDVILVHHGVGQVMTKQLVPKAERLCVADADGSSQPQLRFGVKGLLMGLRAFVPEIVVEHTYISTGAGAGDLAFIDSSVTADESDLVTVLVLQQKTITGDGPDEAGVELALIIVILVIKKRKMYLAFKFYRQYNDYNKTGELVIQAERKAQPSTL